MLLRIILVARKTVNDAIKALIEMSHPPHLIAYVCHAYKFIVLVSPLYIRLGISNEISKSLAIFKLAASLIF